MTNHEEETQGPATPAGPSGTLPEPTAHCGDHLRFYPTCSRCLECSRRQVDAARSAIEVDRPKQQPRRACLAHRPWAKPGCGPCETASEGWEATEVQAKRDPHSVIRSVKLTPFAAEEDDVPIWMWEYGGKGRISVGTLVLFAGRPAAGKSTAGRAFAAECSNGTLPGCWYGTPVNVAYIAAEESAKYIQKPGLRAAGANLDRVFMPKVEFDGEEVRFLSSHDMASLTDELLEHGVKLVVVDPLMSTIGSRTDINRNNEVRSLIEPWAKLAEAIDGVVLGIAHLNKSGNGDVVAGINGSSAFGEVARAVFGFAKDPESDDGDRIMSQEKNSIGEEDLALTYRIGSEIVTTDSGKSAEVGKFVIIGDSDRTVGDVLRFQPKTESDGSSGHAEIDEWLLTLLEKGPVESKDVYSAANAAGYSTDKAKRAKSRLNKNGTVIETFRLKVPGPWWWWRHDTPKGAAPPAQESPNTQELAPLLPYAPLQVSAESNGGGGAQGSKGAREQGSTREDDFSRPLASVRPAATVTALNPATTVDAALVERARAKVIDYLADGRELTVNEIRHTVYIKTRPALPAAIEALEAEGVISSRQDGQKKLYRLTKLPSGQEESAS